MIPPDQIVRPQGKRPAWLLALLLVLLLPLSPAQSAISQGSEISEINQSLFRAVELNDMAAVKAAIANGADLYAKNDIGMSSADLAVEKGHFIIAHFLLSERSGRKSALRPKVRKQPSLSVSPATSEELPAPIISAKPATSTKVAQGRYQFPLPPKKPAPGLAHEQQMAASQLDKRLTPGGGKFGIPPRKPQTPLPDEPGIDELIDDLMLADAPPPDSEPQASPDSPNPQVMAEADPALEERSGKVSQFFESLIDLVRPGTTTNKPAGRQASDTPTNRGTLKPEDLVQPPTDADSAMTDNSMRTSKTLQRLEDLMASRGDDGIPPSEMPAVEGGPEVNVDDMEFAPQDDFNIALDDPEITDSPSAFPSSTPQASSGSPQNQAIEERLRKITTAINRGVTPPPLETLLQGRRGVNQITAKDLDELDRLVNPDGQNRSKGNERRASELNLIYGNRGNEISGRSQPLTKRDDSSSRFSDRIIDRIKRIRGSEYSRLDEYGLPVTSRATQYLEYGPTEQSLQPPPADAQPNPPAPEQIAPEPELRAAPPQEPSLIERMAGFYKGGKNPGVNNREDEAARLAAQSQPILGGKRPTSRTPSSIIDPERLASEGTPRLDQQSAANQTEPTVGLNQDQSDQGFLDSMTGLLDPSPAEPDPLPELNPGWEAAILPGPRQPTPPVTDSGLNFASLPDPWLNLSNGLHAAEAIELARELRNELDNSLTSDDLALAPSILSEPDTPAGDEMVFAPTDSTESDLDSLFLNPEDPAVPAADVNSADTDSLLLNPDDPAIAAADAESTDPDSLFLDPDDSSLPPADAADGLQLDFPDTDPGDPTQDQTIAADEPSLAPVKRGPPPSVPYSDPLREPTPEGTHMARAAPDDKSIDRLSQLYQPPVDYTQPSETLVLDEQEKLASSATTRTPSRADARIENSSSFWNTTTVEASVTPTLRGLGTSADWQTTQSMTNITLTLGDSVNLENSFPPMDNGIDPRNECVKKNQGTTLFCIEPIDWPASIKEKFVVPTILYTGPMAIVRYDQGAASRFHALFPSAEFDSVRQFYTARYGNPTESWNRSIAPLAQPRQDNPTLAWRSIDPKNGAISVLEMRKFDDSRGGFPDINRGAVMLYYDHAPTIFPQVSSHELMRINRSAAAEPG